MMNKNPERSGDSDFCEGRRKLLAVGAVGGAAAVLGLVGCGAKNGSSEGSAPTDREFHFEEISLTEIQSRMASGELTAGALTSAYLERIGEVDSSLRSVLEINPDALAIADRLDAERAQGKVRGPLHGVPVLLKDNIDTADGMTTTAGSLALEGLVAARDSSVAASLRAAGAVLLGKANLSEWANFRSERSSSGWSGRGGQCGNPYALDRSPCGSSSGSAAATSANLCAVAIGTETNGSVVCPSSACSLVGIKPTVGLVSRAGIIPIAHSQDTAGPLARTVADAVAVLSVLTAPDERDQITLERPVEAPADYTVFLDPAALRGSRVGVARQFFGFHERVDRLLEEALQAMRDEGAELVDEVKLPQLDEVSRHSYEVLLYEFKAGLNQYLADLGDAAPVRSLEEIIRFNEEHRDVEMPYFEQEIFIAAQAKGGLDSAEYREALETCKRLAGPEGIDAVMDEHRLDVIVAPTGGPPWKIDLVNGDHFGGGSSTAAAVAGYPNITVPAGYVSGLPVGLSFFGRAFSEATLIGISYAFEQATRLRRSPTLPPSLDLAAAG